jgi:hypothetical protein
MRSFLLLTAVALGNGLFAQPPQASTYEQLREYEGQYKYFNNSKIQFAASPRDENLYMLVREAKHPLRATGRDAFEDSAANAIMFSRDKKGRVNGYNMLGQNFAFIKKVPADDRMWYAREPEGNKKFAYKRSLHPKLNDGINTGAVGAAGLDKKLIQDMIAKVADGSFPDVHSILVARNGKLVVEEYFYEYDRNSLHALRSATKPFISALIGIALGKGLIRDIDEPVSKFISNYDEKTTLRDLLTLQSGFECDRTVDSCFHDAVILGRIIENVSHQPLEAFARQHLFEPMGISQYKWDFKPAEAASDVSCQLYLRPRDVLKFGMLFLSNGQWNGKQVIPPGWVRESLSKQSEVNDGNFGYLWWLHTLEASGQKYEGCIARGNGGQRIFLFPKYNLLTVVTGGSFNKECPSDEMVSNYVLAGLKNF